MLDIRQLNPCATGEVSEIVRQIREWAVKISSALRIGSAKDDPAGLGVREVLRADIAEMRQGSRNIGEGISFVQTAEASAGQIQNNFVRMKELATQAATGTYSEPQKKIMQQEYQQLAEENQRILSDTRLNEIQVHQDNQTISVHFGQDQTIDIATLPIESAEGDIIHDAEGVVNQLQESIERISAYRGNLGSTANRLAVAADVVDIQAENLQAAESRISDADMARTVASMTADKVIAQSSIATQVHADTLSQVVLMLLG